MLTQRNITQSLIGKNINATSATRAENLLAGEIGIANKFNKILTTDADTFDAIVIHQGGSNRRSDIIPRSAVKSIKTKAYVAPTEQITYIGYNGTSGDLEAINSNNYIIRMTFTAGDRSQEFPAQRILHGSYVSDATTTKLEVADGIVKNLNAQARKLFENDVQANVVLSNAGTAVGAAADTVVGYRGSVYVTITDVAANASVTAIAAGDYFRVGTAVTDPVYKVVASTVGTGGGILTLDRPLLADISLLGTTTEMISAANAAASSVGIKLNGVARTFNLRKKIEYRKAIWETSLTNFGTAAVSSAQAANFGSGTYEQVATEDLFTDISMGNRYRKDHLYSPNLYAETGGQYGCVTITYADPTIVTVGPEPLNWKTIRVWFNNTSATNASNFLTVLGDFIGASYSF
jgi:hypothetical protein